MNTVTETLADQIALFDGLPAMVKKARDHVDDRLGITHPLGDYVKLVVSELFTNAIQYTRSGAPGGCVMVLIEELADAIRVDVFDEGSDGYPEMREFREIDLPEQRRSEDAIGDMVLFEDDADLRGRGLFLVASLSRCWDVYSHDEGLAVTCEIPLDLPPLPPVG